MAPMIFTSGILGGLGALDVSELPGLVVSPPIKQYRNGDI